MTIGILGAGALGSNLARALAKNGVPALISNSRGSESLKKLAQELGPTVKPATVEEAARAEIVVIAVPWKNLKDVMARVPRWEGRIAVDATNPLAVLDPASPEAKDPSNPLAAFGIKAIDLGGRPSSAVFSELAPGARVVKAFNHLPAQALTEANVSGGQRVLFYSGDDADAKGKVRAIIEQIHFYPVDLGMLNTGGPLSSSPFGPLFTISFVKI